jgi:hypothetical protein
MNTWLLILLLLSAGDESCRDERPAPPRPPQDEHVEQIVLGKRHDLEIEVKERLTFLSDLSDEVLRARRAFIQRVQARLSGALVPERLQEGARARAMAAQALIQDLEGPHPICAYLIDGSGGHKISEPVWPLLDALRRWSADGAPDADALCSRPSITALPEWARLCQVAVTGDASACEGSEVQELCEHLADPGSYEPARASSRDVWFVFTLAHVLRTGDDAACRSKRTPWITAMCSAVLGRSRSRCPLWKDWFRSRGFSLTRNADRLVGGLDLLVEVENAPDEGRSWIHVVAPRPVVCHLVSEGPEGEERLTSETLVTPEGPAIVRAPLNTPRVPVSPSAVRCKLQLP